MRDLVARLRAYAAVDDPLAGVAATVALVVLGNQPFYPLYLHAIAGTAAWPVWLTLLSSPFFLAVPAVARRSAFAGRLMLPVVGVANTLIAIKAVGRDSGLDLFLLPCALLAAVLVRPQERLASLPVLALPVAAYFWLGGLVGAPLVVFPAEQQAAMLTVNAVSVASLIVLIGVLVAGLPGRSAEPVG
ncbi:hypothetical protein [Rhodoplanes roseus]|uniref:Adenylate cyclase MASE7 domain-containing protein n=1 Tax=Rhodoplanes roseus TaxID=29409 RepID=A0A327KUL4_9BRAD|nr:hypothetical protein [Rhodoplanes roseus]RAI42529.1 hypothetical protein CH341_19070 [Rhodoplanes roseus]